MPFEGVQRQQFDILPDRSLQWEISNLSDYAWLYKSPGCSDELAAAVVHYSTHPPDDLPGIGYGGFGDVFDLNGFALKVYSGKGSHVALPPGRLDDVKANVALSTGLDRITQSPNVFGRMCEFSAPKIYAAVVPSDRGDSTRNVVWAMELIKGKHPSMIKGKHPSVHELPSLRRREKRYRRALGACGIPRSAKINFDDIGSRNLLITSPRGANPTKVVKIDIMAREELSRYY